MLSRELSDITMTDVLVERRSAIPIIGELAFHDLARGMADKPNEIFPQS
jgi:hypothetical protein